MNKYLKSIQDELYGNLPLKIRDDAYTFIIGLGGSGVKYAGETKELLLRRYGETEVSQKIDFYCLDTSDKDKPQNMSNNEFYKLTGLVNDSWIDGWLNPDLLKRRETGELKENSDGAGGVRMVGRWKLFSAAPHIMQHIDTIIDKYGRNIGQLGINKIFIVVMGSICGGTGCGTFIDIPYFVRKSIESHRLNEALFDFYGMLELPDSKIDSSRGMDVKTKEKSRANAYAALKDLEYYMREDTEYTAKFRNDVYTTKNRIFNRCFLLSNIAIDVERRIKYNRNALGASTTYLSGAIPEAVNIMISTEKRGRDDKGDILFGFDPYMDNIRTGGFYKDEKNNKELLVSTFGVSKIEIPMAEIILAIFNRVFIGLKNRWELMEDKDLMRKVILNEVLPIFRVKETFDLMLEIADVSDLTENDLTSSGFIQDINARIKNIITSDRYNEAVTKLKKNIKEKIDEIYLTHGPFFALKVFERDIYGAYLDNALSKIKPPATGNLTKSLRDYAAFKPGFFKQNEKNKMKEDLLQEVHAYVRPQVYELWAKQINEIKQEINRDYHEGLFKRVTEMVKEMREIFSKMTGVDNYTNEEELPDVTVFSWNFSEVPYNLISEKINLLFAKRITVKKPGSSDEKVIFTKSKIHPVEKGRANPDKELFYYPKSDTRLVVQYKNDQHQDVLEENVIAIDEVMQFKNGAKNEISIEEMIRKFLADIKNRKDTDVFEIILSNFKDIVGLFNKVMFTDMIILSSPKVDLSKPVDELDERDKRELFANAIRKHKDFALPSFPVKSDFISKQLTTRHYAVTIEPEFSPEYDKIIDDIRDGIISRNDTSKLKRKHLSAMITVNFYFDYPFESYIEMDDCKAEYDKIKDTNMGAGMHVAEGAVEDIRPLLRELE